MPTFANVFKLFHCMDNLQSAGPIATTLDDVNYLSRLPNMHLYIWQLFEGLYVEIVVRFVAITLQSSKVRAYRL